MKHLFNWLLPRPEAPALEAKSHSGSVFSWHGFGDALWSSRAPESMIHEGFGRNPIVYRCVRMISEAAASVPWSVNEKSVELDEHPILKLLRKPNVHSSGSQLREQVFGQLLLFGNAFLKLSMDDTTVREICLLPANCVSVKFDQSGHLNGYEFQNGSRKQVFPFQPDQSQVIHISQFNPTGQPRGQSPLSAAHMAVDIHNSACRWNKALLDNSARPSGALVYSAKEGGNLSEEQFSRLKTELEDGYSGPSQAGRPLVLEGGLDWKAMGFSPKDMDFMQAKHGAARDIALAFGVPPMLLGIPGDNTYSNYKEANRAFWLQVVIPLASLVCDATVSWLADWFDEELQGKLDLDQIDALATDREKQWARIGAADFLSEDEKRAAVGYGSADQSN